MGEVWQRFAAKTSILPFVAILQGRNSLRLKEISWWQPVIAITVYSAVLYLHERLFGVPAI